MGRGPGIICRDTRTLLTWMITLNGPSEGWQNDHMDVIPTQWYNCTTLQPCWQKLGQEVTERPLLKNCHSLTSFSILLQYIRWVIFSWPSLLLSLTTTCNYSVRGGDTGSGCGGLCNVCVSLNMSPLYSKLSTKVAQGASIVKLVEWQSDLTFFAVYIQPVQLLVIYFFSSANLTALSHTTIYILSLQTIISFLSPLQTINYVLHNKTVKFVEIIKCFLQILIELITVYYICKLLLNL